MAKSSDKNTNKNDQQIGPPKTNNDQLGQTPDALPVVKKPTGELREDINKGGSIKVDNRKNADK